jgi:RNA polymerase sigma-70 factor (ECF subfamily)
MAIDPESSVEAMEESDTELMLKLANGDDHALNALMVRWGKRVTSFLFKMTGQREAAVDLAQETFVKLYQARAKYRASGIFSTYLFTIAANLARNHARWKSRHPTISLDATDDGVSLVVEASDPANTPDKAADVAEEYRIVCKALLALPHDLREALSLFVYEEMGYAEIAMLTRCSAKAVETRIYRARQILKDQLQTGLRSVL